MDDGMAVDVIDASHDAVLELVFGGHPDVTEDRASELGEEALDQVEPRAVLGGEGKFEAVGRLGGEPSPGLSGDVCGMIVEDQLDRGVGWISSIEKLEELDELAAAVAVSDERMDLAGQQINPGQQAERAVAFVLMIPRKGRIDAGFGRQIARRRCDRLDSRLFVIGDDGHPLVPPLRFGRGFLQDLNFTIDAQNFRHLRLELGVALFQIVAHPCAA